MENPIISIIVPVYNSKAFLKKCIHCLLIQRFNSFEIIIIDDGSTDGSSQLCDELAMADERVLVIHSENKGASCARNLGLQVARGSYLAFVDSDDWVTEDYLDTLYQQYVQQNTIDLSIISYVELDEGKHIPTIIHEDESIQLLSAEEVLCNLYHPHMFKGYLWNKLFRRDIIQRYHLQFDPKITIWEDMLFCCEYLKYTRMVSYSKKVCYFYVIRKENLTSVRTDAKEKTKLLAAKKMLDLEIMVAVFNNETKKRLIVEYIYLLLAREFMNGKFNLRYVKEIINEIDQIDLTGNLSPKFRFIVSMLRKNPLILYWIYRMKGQHVKRRVATNG